MIYDKINDAVIKTDQIKYFKDIEQINTFGETQITIEKNIFIKTKDLIYLKNSNDLKSNYRTTVKDKYQNSFVSDDFLFNINDHVLKGQNVSMKDVNGNVYFFKSFFSDTKNNEFYGKDIRINFSNKSFGNSLNEPRLYGNTLASKDNDTILSKGAFTTCKKTDGCPPGRSKLKKLFMIKKKKLLTT